MVLPIDLFEKMLDRLEDESDLRAIREAKNEPLHDQKEAEDYIFMNPVKRERIERGWTQKDRFGAPRRKTIDHSQMGKKRVLSIEKIPGINWQRFLE